IEGDGDLAGARVVDDVGAIGPIVELRLPAVSDIEPRRPAEDVVAFAAVEFLDLIWTCAAGKSIRAATAEQRRESMLGAQAVVAAGPEQGRHAGRQMHAVGERLRRIETRVVH